MRPFPTSHIVPPPQPPTSMSMSTTQSQPHSQFQSQSQAQIHDSESSTRNGRTGHGAKGSGSGMGRGGGGTSFYLPSPATNTDAALSRVPSRHAADPTSRTHSRRPSGAGQGHGYGHDHSYGYGYSSSLSVPASPSRGPSSHHRRSRTSLAGLRNALQTYQVPSEATTPASGSGPGAGAYDPRTPLRRYSPAATSTDTGIGAGTDHHRPISVSDLNLNLDLDFHRGQGGRYLDFGGGSSQDDEGGGRGEGSEVVLRSPFGLGQEMMDALVEIHRVLYRGGEDVQMRGESLKWEEQGQEVKRVVERWFEGDCTYDHPLAKVNSRESLLTHFILLHLVSTGYLPSLSPSALVQHARDVTAALRAKLLGDDEADLESSTPASLSRPAKSQSGYKGKEKADEAREAAAATAMAANAEPEWYGLNTPRGGGDSEADESKKGWWKAWDVSADCKEIGGMECYDGYHLALIEHTITLTLLPSLSSRRPSSVPSTPLTSESYDLPTAGIPPPSFLTRLAQGLAEEFDYLLHWDLPISTLVEFNEVGKATRVRDVIDVGDAIETFVPFAKRVGWITRRLTGFVSSTLGALAVSMLPSSAPIRQIPVSAGWSSIDEKRGLGLGQLGTAVRPPTARVMSDSSEPNSLGLEGVDGPMVSSMAPDCDAEALVQDE